MSLGLFSSIASVLGASSKKKAAKAAAAAQQQAAQAGIDQQNAQFAQTQQNIEPWLQGGAQAIGQQGNLLGLGGAGVQQQAIDALKASPYYQSLFGNGQEALLASASATGGLRGGNTQGALANFGRDTLAQTIQQQVGNLGALSGQGLGAATGLGQLGAENAGTISQLLQNQGAAKAGGILGASAANQQKLAALGNVFSDVFGSFDFSGGGGSGGQGGSGGGINFASIAKAFI